jgi:hypothetical protein
MFGWAGNTAYQHNSRGVLPPPNAVRSKNPGWKLVTIYHWADATDREIIWDPWGIVAPAVDAGASEELTAP